MVRGGLFCTIALILHLWYPRCCWCQQNFEVVQRNCQLTIDKVTIAIRDEISEPFAGISGKKPNYDTFEGAIIQAICSRLNEEKNKKNEGSGKSIKCLFKSFKDLDQRFTMLEEDTVDIIVARFSVSADRAQRVHFVEPYYYADGAHLFTTEELATKYGNLVGEDGTWDRPLFNAVVCMQKGHVHQAIVSAYGSMIVNNYSTYRDQVAAIKRRECELVLGDYTEVASLKQLDLVPVPNLKSSVILPLGIAVQKNRVILQTALEKIMRDLHTRKKGESKSELEKIEDKFLVKAGFERNNYLAAVADIITVRQRAEQQRANLTIGLAGWQAAPIIAHKPNPANPDMPKWDESTLEVKLARQLCEFLKMYCNLVLVGKQDLKEREERLKDGSVDIVIAMFTVTSERSQVVEFVQPYYYSSGSTLFVLQSTHSRLRRQLELNQSNPEQSMLAAVQGKVVCYIKGWYRLPQAAKRVDSTWQGFGSQEEAVENLKLGRCQFLLSESVNLFDFEKQEIVRLDQRLVVYTMPYAVAVPLGHSFLRKVVEDALVEIFAANKMQDIEQSTVGLVSDVLNPTVECNSEKLATDKRICLLQH